MTAHVVFNISGSWKQRTFKEYNFDAMGIPPVRGHLHPLMKVRAQYRQIFLEMGLVCVSLYVCVDVYMSVCLSVCLCSAYLHIYLHCSNCVRGYKKPLINFC